MPLKTVLKPELFLPWLIRMCHDQFAQVIWRDPRSEMLTINEQRLADDPRIAVLRPYVKEWNLRIDAIRKSDQGVYSCVINTSPTVTKHVDLKVQCK